MKPLEGFDVQQTNFDVWDGSVASDFAGGTGTQLDPYLISSASQLAYLASKVNTGTNYSGKYFALTVSLDLNFLEWTPIGGNVGSTTRIFHGIFDGYNHTAANLYVNVDTNYAGLFGYGGTISNLNITDASVTGVNYVGGAAG
ncbi:MAG: hypothetical protein LBB94_12600, partial [Clostridiales bacterium]|nr:hypothetical protein [Clostridiales bacterium]